MHSILKGFNTYMLEDTETPLRNARDIGFGEEGPSIMQLLDDCISMELKGTAFLGLVYTILRARSLHSKVWHKGLPSHGDLVLMS
jgi:hypothetical protein